MEFVRRLPRLLAGETLREVAAAWVKARRDGRQVLLGMGAHPLKEGLSPVILDFMRRRLITGLAMNGAGIVHDAEIAMVGRTSEDVDSGFDPNTYTQNYLDTLRQYAAPLEELRRQEALESRLFGRGMLGSVSGARQVEDFQRMLLEEDLQRILTAKDKGVDEYGKLLGLFGTATGGMQDIDSQLMGLFGQYNQLVGNALGAQQSSADRIYQAALAGIAGQMQGRIGMAQGLGNLIGGLGSIAGSLFSSSNAPSTVNIPGMGLGTYNTSGYDITKSPLYRGLY